jgi:hypothetical protein
MSLIRVGIVTSLVFYFKHEAFGIPRHLQFTPEREHDQKIAAAARQLQRGLLQELIDAFPFAQRNKYVRALCIVHEPSISSTITAPISEPIIAATVNRIKNVKPISPMAALR